MDSKEIDNKYKNYCSNNGKLNIKENIDYFSIKKDNQNNCPNCENKIMKSDTYCSNCGQNLVEISIIKNIGVNQRVENTRYKDIISKFDMISCFKTALLSIFILFGLSSIIKFLLLGNNNEILKAISPVHVMILSHMSNIKVMMSFFMNNISSTVSISLVTLLVLPVLSILVSYKIFMKKRNTSLTYHFRNSIMTSIIYAIMLGLMSKLFTMEMSLSNQIGQYGSRILIGFSVIDVIIKTFLISFIVMLFVGTKKEYQKENNMIYIFKLVIKTILVGYILTFVIIVILQILNIDYINMNYIFDLRMNSNSKLPISIMISQLAVYLWAFANFIPINLNSDILSIFTLFDSNGSLNLMLVLGAMLALSSLVLIISGSKLRKTKDIKPVIIFSVLYSTIIAIMSLLSSIYIGSNIGVIFGSGNIYLGFNFMISMIISFAYSFIMTLVGYKLSIFN